VHEEFYTDKILNINIKKHIILNILNYVLFFMINSYKCRLKLVKFIRFFVLDNKNAKLERLYRFLATAITKSIYNTKFEGFDKIPQTGPVLIIANHVSYVDGLMLQAAINRPVRYMIDQYIYDIPAINYFMKVNKAIPILPKKESVANALNIISDGLEAGDAICIFPEGQLTYSGNLGRFKLGIEWIIERDPVPIYPVAIKGLWNSMFSRKYRHSKFRWFPKGFRGKVSAKCGEAIHPKDVRVDHLQRVILSLKTELDQE
jgi:1-acyl-sn-glycerol-3-phosphate acyltransferase